MTTHPHDELADALADPALAALLAELEAVASAPPPPIGSELAAVLGGAVPLAPGRPGRRHAASFAVIALLSGGVVAGGVGAAAADELPAPVQRVVSRVVSTLTPFEVPHPDHAPRHHDDPGPSRPSTPVVPDDERDAGLPAQAPRTTDPQPAEPDDSGTRSDEGSDEGSGEADEQGPERDSAQDSQEGAGTDDERETTGERGGDDGTDRAGSDQEGTTGDDEERHGDDDAEEPGDDGPGPEHGD
jgi:hypothetical protein